ETLVVDWGLAKDLTSREHETRRAGSVSDGGKESVAHASGSSQEETRAGAAIGTPAYMSPEQAKGDWGTVGPASDVYALGATLYALLTGQPPFTGRDSLEVLERVKRGHFPPPRRVNPAAPAALEAVCLGAMALRPSDRYPSAQELAAEVE